MPDSLVKFFETFYQISDTLDAHEKYADCFTKEWAARAVSVRDAEGVGDAWLADDKFIRCIW